MTPNPLIELAKGGDRNALSTLLMEHRGLVSAIACRFVNDPEQRKDVIQNIFVKTIRHLGQFAGACRFSTWLYRLSVNECIEHGRAHLRNEGRTDPLENSIDADLHLNAPDGFSFTSSSELKSAVAAALKTLPLDQKTAFSLFYFGSYSGKEGAEALSISEANFFMKLKAARDVVKRHLLAKGWTV
jgi:RNA polymerase sigma factor (sigma-70 family)